MAQVQAQPYNRVEAITKSDTVNFDGTTTTDVTAGTLAKAFPCEAIQAGGAGIIQAVQENSRVVPITVAAGDIVVGKFIRVNDTSTTATVMTALYTV